jgi:hypothetical protein
MSCELRLGKYHAHLANVTATFMYYATVVRPISYPDVVNDLEGSSSIS